MASTCTFFNGDERYKNYQCFAPLLIQNKDQYIIIEYSKLYFDKSISEEYLNDICNLFNIEYIKEKNNYKVFVSDIEGLCNRKLFFMIIRFLWERNRDNFTDVVVHYFYIKNNYIKITDILERICLACNCYLSSTYMFNVNHFLCEVRTTLTYGKGDIKTSCKIMTYNEFLDNYKTKDIINYIFYNEISIPLFKKSADNFTKEDYESIFKKLEYEFS